MPISSVELDRFNDNFISALGGLGVDITDQDMIRTILESYKQDIINPTYICRKYAKTLGISQIDLMSSIVSTVLFGNSLIYASDFQLGILQHRSGSLF